MKYKEFKKWSNAWIEMIKRLTPEKPKDAIPGQNWPPTVELYGCQSVDKTAQPYNKDNSNETTV